MEITSRVRTRAIDWSYGNYEEPLSVHVAWPAETTVLVGGGDESINTFVYGLQALGRFYVLPSRVDLADEVPTGQFFVETHAGIAGINVEDGPTTNGFAFGFGPGYSLFLNDSVALEGSVKYNGLAGGGNTTYQHSLGINIGVQVFLPFSQAEEKVEEF